MLRSGRKNAQEKEQTDAYREVSQREDDAVEISENIVADELSERTEKTVDSVELGHLKDAAREESENLVSDKNSERSEQTDVCREISQKEDVAKEISENIVADEVSERPEKTVDSLELGHLKDAAREDSESLVADNNAEESEIYTPLYHKGESSRYYSSTGVVGSPLPSSAHNKNILYQRNSSCDVKSELPDSIENIESDFPDDEHNLCRLKERLLEKNKHEAKATIFTVPEDSDLLYEIEELLSSACNEEKSTGTTKMSADGVKVQNNRKIKTPNDMLTKNGYIVRTIFMLGNAAHGKTTFCKWLLHKWFKGHTVTDKQLNEWEVGFRKFDFVFYLPLRYMDPSKTNITDMICQDISQTDSYLQPLVRRVLPSIKYRCFVIIDGLDEWKPNKAAIKKLRRKFIPNVENMSNCVIFYTMRPWMFYHVSDLVRDDARVIQIKGLDDNGIESAIDNALVRSYDHDPKSDEYKSKRKEIIRKIENKTHKLICISLLVDVYVQILLDKKEVLNSITGFYSKMVDMLVQRALISDKINYSIPEGKKKKHYLAEILSENENIDKYFSALLKLGKAAYDALLSKKLNVFEKRKLEKEIGHEEVMFALDVGLINHLDPVGIIKKQENVSIFHQSVQEFLAAIYVVTYEEVHNSFCNKLHSIKDIMELSNVIMFICGMCPSRGSTILQHVVNKTDSDTEIRTYRQIPETNSMVEELYKLQMIWYTELKEHPIKHDSQVIFHVSDVHLCLGCDRETLRITSELLSDGFVDIRSLFLLCVPNDAEDGIPDNILNSFLSNTHKTKSLCMLFIDGSRMPRSMYSMYIPTLRTVCLTSVIIEDRDVVHHPLLTDMTQLQKINLRNIHLSDRQIGLTPQMNFLETIQVWDVDMTSSGWERLFRSFIDIEHKFYVLLIGSELKSEFLEKMMSSPHFSLIQKEQSWFKFERNVQQ